MPVAPHDPARTAQAAQPLTTVSLLERYKSVQQQIARAAQRAGRNPADIVLVAVAKNASIDEVRQLIEAGHVDFGENRAPNLLQRAAQIEEFLQRHRQLHGGKPVNLPKQVRWHMIGHLQRNKVRKLIGVVRLIQSVDSLRLAEEIQAAVVRQDEPVDVLVQVNTSGERTKSGVAPAAAQHLVEQIDTMLHLRPRGLMCMAPLSPDPQQSRPTFDRCRELFEEIRTSGAGGERFDILSMGMSNDYEVAIECGANVLRVGTAIFGPGTPQAEGEIGH
jgi:pyridoxal phosphate enzyme (YggS family)